MNKEYIQELNRMLVTNQKKLEDVRGIVADLKERANRMENKMDELERALRQSDPKKKKNRRTAAEIAKIYKVFLVHRI